MPATTPGVSASNVSVRPLAGDRIKFSSPLIAYGVAGLASVAFWAGLIGLLLG